jgi:hypothetical protein
MATTVDYIEYVCEQVRDTGTVRYKKMFGEHMVHVDDKPVLLMLFLVREDGKWFSLHTQREKLGFSVALTTLLGYYTGWMLYFTGHQSIAVMLGFLVALPPIYYAFIGVWRRSTPLVISGLAFLGIHLANVSVNLIGG